MASLALCDRARTTNGARLSRLPNVVGTMLGRKKVQGVAAPELSVIVLVSKKRPSGKFGARERVPKTLRIGDQRVITDVVEFPRLRPQRWTAAIPCSDNIEFGLVSGFARTRTGVFGLTCAHVLRGIDEDPLTPCAVMLRNGDQTIEAGRSITALYSSGLGAAHDFGFSDVALFSVDNAWAKRACEGLSSLDLTDVAPRAASAKYVEAQTSRGIVTGVVSGVKAKVRGAYCDYVIDVDGAGMFGGDSGALWRLSDGRGVAIHALGTGDGSPISAAMSFARIVKTLGIPAGSLLAPP